MFGKNGNRLTHKTLLVIKKKVNFKFIHEFLF